MVTVVLLGSVQSLQVGSYEELVEVVLLTQSLQIGSYELVVVGEAETLQSVHVGSAVVVVFQKDDEVLVGSQSCHSEDDELAAVDIREL